MKIGTYLIYIPNEDELPQNPQLIAYQKEQIKNIQQNATDTTKVHKVKKSINIRAEKIKTFTRKATYSC